MTVTTVCRNCGVRADGLLKVCPDCGSMDVAEETNLPAIPEGCECGNCEQGPNMLVVRCAGVAMAIANAGGTL